MNSPLVVGVDIGGSHIATALVDCKKRVVLENSCIRRKIDAGGTSAEIINEWALAIKDSICFAELPVRKVGIAMPGPFDYTQGISYMKNQNKFDSLYGLNIRNLISTSLGIHSEGIHFSNDAACFLQGELFVAKENLPDYTAGFTLGTGFGSAITEMNVAVDANLWCAPFKQGTAEDYLSTRWFVENYQKRTGFILTDVLSITEQGDQHIVAELFDDFGKNLGEFLLFYYYKYKWEYIILGGSISLAYPLFAPALLNQLKQSRVPITIKISKLGESAALVGAAGYVSKLHSV
ncbi:ROK family protein [Flavihumibacter sp. UBA7668]|uniref:ROK family protein n=1 Tax=Flavihumibacter sp. UBA7668 TaxID=1946542 RepID=UPI0025B7EA29|nr:ROK family protein [Flavihumibacter sp. UBA7668]